MSFKADLFGPKFNPFDGISYSEVTEEPLVLLCECEKGALSKLNLIQSIFDQIANLNEKPNWLNDQGGVVKVHYLSTLNPEDSQKVQKIWDATFDDEGFIRVSNFHIYNSSTILDTTNGTNYEKVNQIKEQLKANIATCDQLEKERLEKSSALTKTSLEHYQASQNFDRLMTSLQTTWQILKTHTSQSAAQSQLAAIQTDILARSSKELSEAATRLQQAQIKHTKAQKDLHPISERIDRMKQNIQIAKNELKRSYKKDNGFFGYELTSNDDPNFRHISRALYVNGRQKQIKVNGNSHQVLQPNCELRTKSHGIAVSLPALTRKVSLFKEENGGVSYGELTLEDIKQLPEAGKALINQKTDLFDLKSHVEVLQEVPLSEIDLQIQEPRQAQKRSIFDRVRSFVNGFVSYMSGS